MKDSDEYTKMAERCGAAEVRENNALARIEALEKSLVTCRIRCERAEKRLALELRKKEKK